MFRNINFFILLFFVIVSFDISAQNQQKIDSLLNILKPSSKDTNTVKIYADLCKEFCSSDAEKAMNYANLGIKLAESIKDKKGLALCYNNIGTVCFYQNKLYEAINYYNKAVSIRVEISDLLGVAISLMNIGTVEFELNNYALSNEYTEKSLAISEKIGDKLGVCSCLMNIGNNYLWQSDLIKSLEYFDKALQIALELGSKSVIANCYISIGLVYNSQGDYAPAIENFQKALKIKEEENDQYGIYKCLMNIGNVHVSQGNSELGLEYYKKSIKIAESLMDESGISNCFVNIGNILDTEGKYLLAIEYYQKALKINEKLDDKYLVATCLVNLGNSYLNIGNNKLALEYLFKAIEIKQELNEKEGLSLIYASIASLKYKENKYNEAIVYAQKAYNLAVEIGVKENAKNASEVLAYSYAVIANYKAAYEYHKKFKLYNDSIFNEESSKQVKQMEARYQNEKKQQQIELQDIQLDKKEVEVSKQRTQKLAFVVGFVLMLVLALVIFKNYKEKKKANILLFSQRDEIEKQRDEITVQKKEITDSIHYAKRIQNALLMQDEFANEMMGEHFILFKPKSIVSGDFYWATKIDNQLIFAVADCTGHGVPGGFMSMLGITFLNEIINKEKITQPNLILNEMRNNIIKSLQQKGVSLEQKDGMDIALCNLDIETKKLQYAGAYNSLYYISDKTKELSVVKADKMPVAIHVVMDSFTNHEIQLSNGDIIYLFSDGYEDQFGGPKGKRFLANQFRQLIVDNCQKSLTEQKEIFDNRIEDWKNNYKAVYKQTDDITLMGIKI